MATREAVLQAQQAELLGRPVVAQVSGVPAQAIQVAPVKTEAELKAEFAKEQTAIVQERIDSFNVRIADLNRRQATVSGGAFKSLENTKRSLILERDAVASKLSLAQTGDFLAKDLFEAATGEFDIAEAKERATEARRKELETMTVTTTEIPQQVISGETLRAQIEERRKEELRKAAARINIPTLDTGFDVPTAMVPFRPDTPVETREKEILKQQTDPFSVRFKEQTQRDIAGFVAGSRFIEETFRPGQKRKRIVQEKLEADVFAFNQRFEGKELNPQQFAEAQEIKNKLDQRVRDLESQERKIQSQFAGGGGFVTTAKVAAGSLAIGFITAPLRTAELVSRFATDPFGTLLAAGTGLAGLPLAAIKQPAKVIPEFVGQLLFFKTITTATAKLLSKPAVKAVAKKVEPRVEFHVSKPKPILIKKFKDGRKVYRTKAKAEMRVYNPKTGKLVEKIDVELPTQTYTTPTAIGAVEFYTKGMAEALRKGGTKIWRGRPVKIIIGGKNIQAISPKITVKTRLTEGEVKGTVSPRPKGDVFDISAQIKLRDTGFRRAVLGLDKTIFKDTIFRAKPRASGTLTGQAKIIKTQPGFRQITKDVGVFGKETIVVSKQQLAIFRDTFGVKGFGKRVGKPSTGDLFRIKQFPKSVRRFAKAQPAIIRGGGVSIGTVFEPKTGVLNFRNIAKSIARGRLPKTPRVKIDPSIKGLAKGSEGSFLKVIRDIKKVQRAPSPQQILLLKTAAQVAKAEKIAATQGPRALADALLGKQVSAIKRKGITIRTGGRRAVIPKTIGLTATAAVTSTLLSSAQVTRQRQAEKTTQRQFTGFRDALESLTRTGERTVQRQIPVSRQAQAQRVAQRQRSVLLSIGGFAPTAPTISPPTTPFGILTPPTPLPIILPDKETREEARRRKREAKRLIEQRKAYQASIGSALLGIGITEKEFKRRGLARAKFTGLELRPLIIPTPKKGKKAKKLRSLIF